MKKRKVDGWKMEGVASRRSGGKGSVGREEERRERRGKGQYGKVRERCSEEVEERGRKKREERGRRGKERIRGRGKVKVGLLKCCWGKGER